MKNKLKNIPEVGKYYHFWDDGKVSNSRHYICKCERIITPEEAKNIIVKVPEWDYRNNTTEFVDISLYNHWLQEKRNCKWIYRDETDYFVEASCPTYDDNNLWFVRTKEGGWFSMNIQSSWQSGYLDIDEEILNGIIKEYDINRDIWGDDVVDDMIKKYKNIKY